MVDFNGFEMAKNIEKFPPNYETEKTSRGSAISC